MHAELFGGLMSAIGALIKHATHSEFNNMEFGNLHFYILKREELLFIANSSSGAKEKKMRQELEKISNKFFDYYKKKLEKELHLIVEVSCFQKFDKEISDSLIEKAEQEQ